jgi:hypothetical protein
MRFLAAALALASLLIHVLLGVGYLLSSSYQQLKAETEAGDLSSVAGDLDVSKAELDRMHAQAREQTAGAGRREFALGAGLLASALIQLLAAVLLLLRRARSLALLLLGLALAGMVGVMLVDGIGRLGLTTAILLALALGSALLVRPAPRVTTT